MLNQQTTFYKYLAAWRDATGLSVPSLPAGRQVLAQSRIANASLWAFHFYPLPMKDVPYSTL